MGFHYERIQSVEIPSLREASIDVSTAFLLFLREVGLFDQAIRLYVFLVIGVLGSWEVLGGALAM